MRKKSMMNRRIAALGAVTLSAALLLAGCGGSTEKKNETAASEPAAAAESTTAESAAASKSAATESAAASKGESAVEDTVSAASTAAENGEELLEGEISEDDYDEEFDDEDLDGIELEEFDFEEEDAEDEELTPEQKEMQDYMDANLTEQLLEQFDNVLYEQIMWNKDGTENEMTGYVYQDKDRIYVQYVDGFVEIVTADTYDGFDPELNLPVRYVFADEGTREDNLEAYAELFYLWGDEEIVDRSETEKQLSFTSKIDDLDFIEYILADTGWEAEEGDALVRVTTFDKETKLMEDSTVSISRKDGSTDELFNCKFTVNLEDGCEEDTDLIDKLNSEDTHSLKLVIDPGTEDEVELEATVGKGCAFLPLLYDGYYYFTDKECTLVAEEEELYDTQGDVVLYASMEEIPEDALEDGDIVELEFDEGDEIDLSDLFEDEEEEAE